MIAGLWSENKKIRKKNMLNHRLPFIEINWEQINHISKIC